MATRSKSTTTQSKPSSPSSESTESRSWRPHSYQKKAMRWLLERRGAGLFLDPGLGKTSVTLGAIRSLKAAGRFQGALVLSPLRVSQEVWPAECRKWEQFHDLSIAVLHGKDKKKLAEQRHDIYSMNYEGLPWLVESGTLEMWLKKGWVDVLVVDELSKFKHPKTQRFKALKHYLHRFARRYGLTGSPAANGLEGLFGEIFVLDRGARLGQYITHFRNRYFIPVGLYDWAPKPGAQELIQDAIKDIVLRMDAEDYLELPPQIDNFINVELPPEARTLYEAIHDDLMAMLDKGEAITAPTVAAALQKCKQIANGAVYLDSVDPITGEPRQGPRKWTEVHDGKLEVLADLVEEQEGRPMLIAYEFKHDLERIKRKLGDVPHIGGGTSGKVAQDLVQKWNAGKLPLLLGHPLSVGHGLNLQEGGARAICWFAPTWDYELYDQFNRRLRRQGSTAEHIVVHHIIAKKTVDISVMHALRNKRKIQDVLLASLKK